MMTYESSDRQYGPLVEVEGVADVRVAVSQTYQGQTRSPVLWRGMVTIFFNGRPFMDVESVLLESRTGGKPYIQWAQRSYTDQAGATKYKSTSWCHEPAAALAAAEAVRQTKEGNKG